MYLVCRENLKFEETTQMRDAAKELGMIVSDYPLEIKEGFFLYGTRDFCLKYVDHPYHILNKTEHQYDYSYLFAIAGYLTLNFDAEFLPANRLYTSSKFENSKKYFVRPNSGNKQFTGGVFISDEITNNFPLRNQINPWELCVIASEKIPPEKEYRFFVHNNKMVGTEYWPTNSSKVPEFVENYARAAVYVIREGDPNALTFVLDIGVRQKDLMIVEINSFNSSALYSIPSSKILEILNGDSNWEQ